MSRAAKRKADEVQKKAEEKLERLKAKNLPHCDWTKLFSISGRDQEEATPILDEYFNQFTDSLACPGCGAQLASESLLDSAIGAATFTWGLAHGEGFCSKCGYPARGHHNIPKIGRLTNLVLAYHPDTLTQFMEE
jgi:hypothetical protein